MASVQCEQEARMANVQCEQEVIKQEQSSLSNKVDTLQTDVETRQEDVNLLIKSQQEDVKLLKSQQEDVKLLKSQQEDVQQRVAHVEDQLSSAFLQENREDGSYEGPANVVSQQYHSNVSRLPVLKLTSHFFAKRHDPDTREWLFDDFDAWFRDPGGLQSLCTPWRSRSRQKCARSSPGTAHERDWTLRRCLLLPSQRWHKKRSQVSSWDYR
ncbi:hypothetical protein OS493_037545 [Desmophyllum pertusum]|uniref:Uncharacterized protein n=1 Tax=Desmophyllum pertusum TaxID=174260 RepID=A0A9W9Z674_9CNID|nr:hypothetical protein OS493_037545 [Desmophyllum pertusum]